VGWANLRPPVSRTFDLLRARKRSAVRVVAKHLERRGFGAFTTVRRPGQSAFSPQLTQTLNPTSDTKKTLQIQRFSRAAEGIRTLDLLHGKQSLWSLFGADTACKNEVFRVGGSFCDSTAFTASSREFGHRMGTRAGCPSTVMLSPEQAAGRVARYRNHAIAEQRPTCADARFVRCEHVIGAAVGSLLAQAKQATRCARRRGKPSRGRHLFVADDERVAGLQRLGSGRPLT
jgi:hypothetical protein